MTVKNVIIVGSGPAGVGVAALLNQSDIDYTILEKNEVGNSFSKWPKNMHMITPSFPSNAFGQMDLNSIIEATSPAFTYKKEHLTGKEYADYLRGISNHFDIHVETQTEVLQVSKHKEGYIVETNQGLYFCKYLIWAAGEYLNPQISTIQGSENCIHSSKISDPMKLENDNYVVIGGYESGVQIAYDLVQNNKKVMLIDPSGIQDIYTSDPSKVLSPYTYEKYQKIKESSLFIEVLGQVNSVTKEENEYILLLEDSRIIKTPNKPICATGFSLVKKPIEEFILYREDGNPMLDEKTDEFIGHDNIYLSGPSVRHDNHIFCFIYKFRQRFGVIVEDILLKEEYEKEDVTILVEKWKRNGLYLSDLSCCDEECVC